MLDALFLSWNRWEFTEQTLKLLYANTVWDQFSRLVVYDDGSEQETVERLEALLAQAPVEAVFRRTEYRSPVAVMAHYLRNDPAPVFVKVDNDVAVPPGWFEHLMSVWADWIDLLGFEIGRPHGLERNGHRPMFFADSHIGGVGLMRTAAFHRTPPMKPIGRYGFTEWQMTHGPVRGWVFPEPMAPCLDRVPVGPWSSLSLEYERRGWQRPWWKYPLEATHFWDWMEV